MAGTSRYEIISLIGNGAYGEVFKGRDTHTDELIAVKTARLSEDGVSATTLREVNLLKDLVHPCLVKLRDVTVQGEGAAGAPSNLWIVLELVPQDLQAYLNGYIRQQQAVPASELQSTTFQVLSALCYCRCYGVLHRDLKPSNILIDPATRRVKLADFGLARVRRDRRSLTGGVQTLWYRAPEVLLGLRNYSGAVDVWSLACVFAEMAALRPLFPGRCEIDQLYRIFAVTGTPSEADWPGVASLPNVRASAAGCPFTELWPRWPRRDPGRVLPQSVCRSGLDLFARMLTADPTQRITCEAALRHPYFDGLDAETQKLGCMPA